MTAFSETIAKAYAVDGGAIDLGRGVHEANLEAEAVVRLPLATMNRHGLIAGATGTGKTRTLQLLAEQLSDAGVSVFAADYKGDLSGLGSPALPTGRRRSGWASCSCRTSRRRTPSSSSRLAASAPAFRPGDGDRLRAGAAREGPGCKRDAAADPVAALPLRRRARADPDRPRDLRALLTYLDSDAGKADLTGIGGVSGQTIGVLLRSLVELEDGGGNEFFGEPLLRDRRPPPHRA